MSFSDIIIRRYYTVEILGGILTIIEKMNLKLIAFMIIKLEHAACLLPQNIYG